MTCKYCNCEHRKWSKACHCGNLEDGIHPHQDQNECKCEDCIKI